MLTGFQCFFRRFYCCFAENIAFKLVRIVFGREIR